MKATLLIKNIENLYLCDSKNTIISQAFVALHHDKILDFGSHDPKKWVDDATRMIDARGECVVPAFIDGKFTCSKAMLEGDRIRNVSDLLYAMKQNGILTLVSHDPSLRRKELFQEVITTKKNAELPIIDMVPAHKIHQEFILSCGMDVNPYKIYSLQPLGFLLNVLFHEDPIKILNAMTRNPAKAYHLEKIGTIKKGNQGDLLVLSAPNIESYFSQIGRPMIHRMIKSGIQFYPSIIRS
ncbi:amidohydrolase family protein [Dubosiella newyorkensis]|uniref:amidohydrolase family protein n=1 Tax=Dubosiella newyorkensis TaxID=1862672 RepID=UPI0023F0E8C0|nr:amidohydrolase family protein [Dubosiella newyorkensis]